MNFKLWIEAKDPRAAGFNIGPVYHGSSNNFKKFSSKKSTMGIIWFSSDKKSIENGEAGAAGKGLIYELYAKINKPMGWKEYHDLLLVQAKSMGYDGAILPEKDGTFTGFVFDPKNIMITQKYITT